MATYVSYTPTTTIGRAMFNFDSFGAPYSNFKLSGTVRVSVSDTFSFADYQGTAYSNFYSGLYTSGSEEVNWTSQMTANIQEITDVYSQFANITFQYQGDFDTFTSGSDFTPNPEDIGRFNLSDINITWIYRPDGTFAGISGINFDGSPSLNYTGAAGDIFLNSAAPKFAGDFTLDLNTRARQTLMHEIGHSLGLSHPHSAYDPNTGIPTITNDYAATKDLGFGQLGFHINSAFDMYKEYFTIMSYDDQHSLLPGSNILFHAHTPMILDVISLQQAYGEGPGTSGSGNDTIAAGNAGYRTYFDKGGVDTIDLSTSYTEGAYLNMGVTITGAAHLVGVAMSLNDAQTTITFGGDPAHLRWFYGEYENAIGASSGDLLIGNVLDNIISGLGGPDAIYGGGGNDFLSGGDGNDQLFGEGGDDILDGSWQFDLLDGGSGVDTADYRFFNFNTSANLGTGRVDFPVEWSDGGQFDTLVSIENILLGSGDDTIYLPGGNISNLVNADGGIDTVYVTYTYNNGYTLSGTSSNLVMTGAAGTDTLQNAEYVVFSDGTRRSTSDLTLPPAGSVSINDVSITEGDSGTKLLTFTATRVGGTAAFDVGFSTASWEASVLDGDYVAVSGALHFNTNVNQQTISVTINGDTKIESNETFFVLLSNATNGATISDGQGIGTITNDDSSPGSVSINDVTITEGDAGAKTMTFTVSRAGGTAAFDVGFNTANWEASTLDGDYAATSGVLHFAANINQQTISVTINGDTKIEPNETFFVLLSNATNGATIGDGLGIGTISNDDTPPGSVSINDVAISEGDGGITLMTFTATRVGGTAAFDVNFTTSNWEATADGDYQTNFGPLHFGVGVNSVPLTIAINGDTKIEPNETFFVLLSSPSNGATISDGLGVGTIVNDDLPPGSVSINDVAISEGDGGTKLMTFTISRSGGTSAFDVGFSTASWEASALDGDYAATSGTLHFNPGVNTQTISVTVNGDTKIEPNETFFVLLSSPSNGATISDGLGVGTINNDDLPPGSVAINDVTIAEGNAGTKVAMFTVTRSGGTSAFDVGFSTANWEASTLDGDYAPTSGALHFGAGVNTQTISVGINGDGKLEMDETFFVVLSGATNGATISDGLGVGTITNDDANHAPVAAIADHTLPGTGWANIANWLSYFDADGHPAAQYQFFDSGAAAGSAHFWTPTGGDQAANTVLTVAAANLGNVWLGGATVAGSEQIWLRAFDGIDWGEWRPFTLTTPVNHPPEVGVADHNLRVGEWAHVASWLSYSDADGHPPSQYQFSDNGTSATSAHFWSPGLGHQPNGALVTVSATDLANLWLGGATAAQSEQIWVRAFDGMDWSTWRPFTLNDVLV